MEDDLICFFENYKILNDMFDTIKARYNVNIVTHMQVLLQQYSSLKMKGLDSITNYVNKMLGMAKDLSVLNNLIANIM